MRTISTISIAGLLALAMVVIYPGPASAGQTPASTSYVPAPVMTDTVVRAEQPVPFVKVYRRGWRGVYGGGWRGGYGWGGPGWYGMGYHGGFGRGWRGVYGRGWRGGPYWGGFYGYPGYGYGYGCGFGC